ncbi:MAG: hypothetical protein ACYCPQ_10440 [Elusimicrobiota bacterium]
MNKASEPLRSQTLSLIRRGHRYSAFYEDILSNHLPMALVALDRMGATDEETAAFAQNYEKAKALEPLPKDVGPISDKTAGDFLGRYVVESSVSTAALSLSFTY